MTVHNNIQPGDDIDLSAQRQNDISDLLNQVSYGGDIGSIQCSTTDFSVYSSDEISANMPVMLSGNTLYGDESDLQQMLFEVIAADESIDKPWGILSSSLIGNNTATATFNGLTLAKINILNITDTYATLQGGVLVSAEAGECKILWTSQQIGESIGLIMLGGNSTISGYGGNFAVTWDGGDSLSISKGYLNCNGYKYWEIAASSVTLDSGVVCITSVPLDKKGNWSTPVFEIRSAPNQCAYPIAEITVTEVEGAKSVSIKQFPVTLAVILYSTLCPIAEM